MTGILTFLVIAVFVVWVVVLLALTRRSRSRSTLPPYDQMRGDVQRSPVLPDPASSKQRRTLPHLRIPAGWRNLARTPASEPPFVQPAAPTPPAQTAPPAPIEPDNEAAATGTTLDSTLTSSSQPPAPPDRDPFTDGPDVVALTPEQERRVLDLMEQGHEVMAVRLVCDETRAGILDAQKTVRTLAGLPSPY